MALLFGVMLANPLDTSTMLAVGMGAAALMVPLMIKSHHRLLIYSSNAFINAFFLPGQPQVWMLMVAVSLLASILSRPLDRVKEPTFFTTPVALPLLCLAGVMFTTAMLRGGIGLKAFGSGVFGGRNYVWVFAAIAGYFAITFRKLSDEFSYIAVRNYALAGVSAIFGNIAFALGPSFYFLFFLFPVQFVMTQATAEFVMGSSGITRFDGLSPMAVSLCGYMLVRHGLRGVLDVSKPMRIVVVLVAFLLSLLSGFRANFLLVAMIFIAQFIFEGLWRTRFLPMIAVAITVVFVGLIGFVDKLPLSAQRSLSFLPIDIDPVARIDAQSSLEWRFEMWRLLLREVPQYFYIGRGYAINPTDMYLAEQAARRGFLQDYEMSIMAGDFHSGPFSVLIPFGVFGVITFVWFIGAGFWALRRNFLYGKESLARLNCFLLSFYTAHVLQFLFAFGALNSDLWVFTSMVGLSISLNAGVRKAADLIEPVTARARR